MENWEITGKGVLLLLKNELVCNPLKDGETEIRCRLDFTFDYGKEIIKILPGGKMLSGRIFTLFPIIENKRYRKKTCYSWGLE